MLKFGTIKKRNNSLLKKKENNSKKSRTIKKNSKTKKNISPKLHKTLIIKNNTPSFFKKIGNKIQKEIEMHENSNISLKSYSPSVNKELISNKSILKKDLIDNCNYEWMNVKMEEWFNKPAKINVGNNKCLDVRDEISQAILLDNLSSKKIIEGKYLITPKQYQSNCWFNTLFMNIFISDKGRKFFKYIRQLMIQGKKNNNEKIPERLWLAFGYLNLYIESVLNGKSHNIDFNTNELILSIYYSIPENERGYFIDLKTDANNPIYYLLDILTYLNYNPIKLEIIEYKNSNTINNINSTLSYIPDIIILKIKNIQTNDNSNEELHKKSVILNINIKNQSIKYRLDSIILRDIKEKHFCSLLTYNKNEYGFDGVSYRKLSKFNWKQMINKNKNWTFKGSNWRENNESIIWNFQNGYQLLFYYRI